MPTASLEFTLFMNTADIGRGMGSVRKTVADGMRGMTQAAKEESLRIQSALASITAFRELKTGVAESRAEWVKAQAEATRLGAAFNQVGPPVKGLKQEFEKAKKAAADAQATFIQQSIALNVLRTSMAAAGVSTTGLAAAQARLRAELAANEAKFQAQARLMNRTQDARNVLNLGPRVNTDREVLRLQAAYERLRATGNLTGVELARAHVRMTEGILALRNGTDSWAGRLMLVREQLVQLAIVGAGIGLSSREAIAFESAMSNVRKVVDFPTPGAFKELTADIKGMAREIPVPLEGLAKIAEAGGQMGIASKEIRGFTEVVAKMSTAFNISPNEAGEAVGRLMNIFKLTVPETQRLGDAINHLGNNTNAVEKDILNVMNRTGGMAKVFGLANTESAALGTAFLALGRPPEIAATAINAMMLILQTAPTREADFKQALARMGISAEKLAADIGRNPQQTLLTFLETLKSLDKQTQSETLATIFGRQYADDISILLAGLDSYKNALDLVSKETNYAGSMQKEFNERVKTTASQMQLASNAISEAGVNLGTVFLPAIVTASQAIPHGAESLEDVGIVG
ncbi:MAG: phage tail tape measure protein, partial [Magnetococcales bacterium]|nr:phage tail tape measure protein [Magnetococcales bacterium]